MDQEENNIKPDLGDGGTPPTQEDQTTPSMAEDQTTTSFPAGNMIASTPSQPYAQTPENPKANPAQIEVKKPKTKKLGLIIATCILAVLLIGGGVFAAVFLSLRQSDDAIVFDAIAGFVRAPQGTVEGTIDVKTNDENQTASGIKSLQIAFGADASETNGAKVRTDGTLKITTADDQEINLTLGFAFFSEGTFYVKIDGIRDALDAANLPSEITTIISSYLDELIEDIDGEWYKIVAADLDLDSEGEASYQCVVDAINKLATKETSDKVVGLIEKYPFLVPTKQADDSDGNSVYNVTWDANLLANFANEYSTITTDPLSACVSSEESEKITAENVTVSKDFPGINLHINSDSRELRAISADYSKDGNSLKVKLNISYDNINVETPQDAKTVGDLIGSFEAAFKKAIVDLLKTQVLERCSLYADTTYYDLCIEAANKQIEDFIENMDISELLKQLVSSGYTSGKA